MFTQGRIAFALFFIALFAIGLIWAYRKDIQKSPKYFKGSYKIVLTLIGIYLFYFILMRWVL